MKRRYLNKSHSQFLLTNLTMILSIFTFVTVTTSKPAFAEQKQKWYQVELILFAINNTEEAYTESWPELPVISDVQNKIELITPTTPTNVSRVANQNNNTNVNQTQVRATQATQTTQTTPSFSTINKSDYRLTVTANKLKNSPKYDLLLHVGWQQPAFRAKDKSAVYLHDGPEPVSKLLSSIEQENVGETKRITEFGERGIHELITEESENTVGTRNNLGFSEPDLRRYFGTFKLTLSRFLHIDIDMIYRGLRDSSALRPIDIQTNIQTDIQKKIAENVNDEFQTSFNSASNFNNSDFDNIRLSTPLNYRLLTSRRVKPDEIHFFDHPKFGLITMVTRYALPKPDDEEPTMQPFIP